LTEMEVRQSELERANRESTNVPGTLPRFLHGFNDLPTDPGGGGVSRVSHGNTSVAR
jgi:hypothetical protein